MANSEFDTIAAISTPVGEGGISIIRISGDEAIEVAKKLYHGSKDLAKVATNTINYFIYSSFKYIAINFTPTLDSSFVSFFCFTHYFIIIF